MKNDRIVFLLLVALTFILFIAMSLSWAMSPDDVIRLRKAGVSDEVIKALIEQEKGNLEKRNGFENNSYPPPTTVKGAFDVYFRCLSANDRRNFMKAIKKKRMHLVFVKACGNEVAFYFDNDKDLIITIDPNRYNQFRWKKMLKIGEYR